jgi:hypothetical protein
MTQEPANPEGAIGKSISFRPASLYDDAVAYGKANAEKQDGGELNPSEVVCLALRRLFESEGFEGAVSAEDARTRFVAKVMAATKKDPELEKQIHDFLCKSTRRRTSRRST